jgi:hypothetical protein
VLNSTNCQLLVEQYSAMLVLGIMRHPSDTDRVWCMATGILIAHQR